MALQMAPLPQAELVPIRGALHPPGESPPHVSSHSNPLSGPSRHTAKDNFTSSPSLLLAHDCTGWHGCTWLKNPLNWGSHHVGLSGNKALKSCKITLPFPPHYGCSAHFSQTHLRKSASPLARSNTGPTVTLSPLCLLVRCCKNLPPLFPKTHPSPHRTGPLKPLRLGFPCFEGKPPGGCGITCVLPGHLPLCIQHYLLKSGNLPPQGKGPPTSSAPEHPGGPAALLRYQSVPLPLHLHRSDTPPQGLQNTAFFCYLMP
ncbi:hypothetical protein GWK47_039163 [Chionoecetes opilio]|uniref:Uncharacterized protein n=1 Tax=Chionoecetes opilio TaxID=41210 RepID=A0A8J5CLR4_CHIOP|nr:hypothetical protein GWK47_039163 [Chionoecetes opilio]